MPCSAGVDGQVDDDKRVLKINATIPSTTCYNLVAVPVESLIRVFVCSKSGHLHDGVS